MTTPHVDPQLGREESDAAERRLLRAAATGTLVDLGMTKKDFVTEAARAYLEHGGRRSARE